MNRVNFYILLSHIATGVALFLGLSGAVWAFFTYSSFSFIAGLSAAIIGLIPGLFLLLLSEALFILIKILQEKQKQTKLLDSIDSSLSASTGVQPADETFSDH